MVLDVAPGNSPYLSLGAALAALPTADLELSEVTLSDPGSESWLAWGDEPDDGDEPDEERYSPSPSRASDGTGSASRIADQLAVSPGLLGRMLRQLAARAGARVLLFVDQLEELHTLTAEEQRRVDFMEMLCAAADDAGDPVRLVFTLRDDFLGRLASGERAREALSRVTLLRAPGPAELEETLVRPLDAVGYRFLPPTLAARMVAEVTGEASSLPLVQFTARLLWDRRDVERRVLSEEIYAKIGGVEGALAEHADGVLEGMTPDGVDQARGLLLRLITPEGTRRVVPRGQIVEGLDAGGEEVLDRLTQARLVSVRRALGGEDDLGGAELELAHESLIRSWERLSRWFDEGREELAFVAQVTQAAELWKERGRRAEEVWSGDALRDALRDARRMHEVPRLVGDFLEAGQRQMSRAQRRRRRWLAAAITLLVFVALGSTIGAVAFARMEEVAQRERDQADEERLRAQARGAEALREGARAAFLRSDLVQARAMLRSSLQEVVTPLGQALWWRLAREPLLWRRELGGDVDAVAFSPDGRFVAALGDAPSVFVFRVEDRSLRTLRGHRQKPDDVAFSPDGRWLASTSSAGVLRLWNLDARTAEPEVTIDDSGGPLAFSPRGDALIAGHRDGRVRLWAFPMEADAPARLIGGDEGSSPIAAVAIDAVGQRIAAAAMDGTTRIFRARDGRLERSLAGGDGPALSVAFHPRDGRVAVGSTDAVVRLWGAAGEIVELRHPDAVRDIAFTANGDLLIAGTAGGVVHLWDTNSGREVGRAERERGQVLAVAVSGDGRLLATGGTDQSLRLLRLERLRATEPDRGHTAAVLGVAFSPDGSRLASGGNDETVRLWSVATGHQEAKLTGRPPSRSTGVAFSPAGDLLVGAGADGALRLWNPETGHQGRSPVGPATYLSAVAFHPEGRLLATASFDGAVRIWDTDSLRLVDEPYHHDAWATDVAFSPDGRLVASGGHDRALHVWDLAGQRDYRVVQDLAGPVHGLAFGPGGSTLAFSVGAEPVQLWDLETDRRRPVGPDGGATYWVAMHPDGRRIGLPRADGTARIVTFDGDDEVRLSGHAGEVNYLRFSPDGQLAATTSDDGTVRLWNADDGRPRWWAPALLTRAPQLWSHRGWETLPGDADSARATAWRGAIESEARLALESDHGDIGCLQAFSGVVAFWDLQRDEVVREERLAEEVEQLVTVDLGCVTLARGIARVHGRDATTVIADEVDAIASAGEGQVLLATRGEVRLVSADGGAPVRSWQAGSWIVAMVRLGEGVAVGFGDGSLEVLDGETAQGATSLSFEGLPASPPVAMLAGPQRTLVVGFRNGVVGIWSLEDGSQLYRFRLHGPARHLALRGGEQLQAVTELGDWRSLDLSLFGLDECQLLRHLWAEVPVEWQEGAPHHRASPSDHRCAP